MGEIGGAVTHYMDNYDKAKLGLFAYPVLMAADILLYNASHVPVGEDQKQHLELARDIAGAFNRQYGVEFFTIPEPLIMGAATRVMSLRDGKKKMSKSDESDFSRINMTDSADVIADKIKRAKSDSETGINYDEEKRPEVANLLNIYGALTDEKPQSLAAKMSDYNFAKFKGEIAEVVVAKIAPITEEYKKLTADKSYIMNILKSGAEAAGEIAESNMKKVKEIVGFI
jgi:tryptophanyl-tRNA synthetase